ncbi:Sodium/glucose cotransporter [Planctomycetes bacterium CA13]|uniref:Sodium/glucose cotransporter n=1 Tax=Novipirellula herctigrandis TaxID=2527986 RepID=A0A5C5Z5T7_9BACT|nr:Sodium/glucose cotransporter [Planctomycetes bacterium CA13]
MTIDIEFLDLVIIIGYLLGIVALGCWVGIRKKGNTSEGKDYFLAGGSLTWPVIGLALFSTNISTIHLVSLAQEGYVNGLAYGNFEWMAPFTLIILALFFAPFYIRSKVVTLPDFLEQRYNRACRDWLAVLSIISAVFIHIGFSLYTGAVVLHGMFGMDLYLCIILTAALTGLYTIVGGLSAVVITESIQTIVLLLGACCITAIAYYQVGGWSGLTDSVDPVKLTVMRPADDPSGLPWYSVLLGYPVIGIWYWCADQTIVQRVLGAKDENHARIGPLFAGFIKIFPLFIFVLPGLMCAALIKQGKLPDELANSADTYAFMIGHLLPVGLKGIVAAALLAALMGTVSGALNSTATLFSYDLFKRWRPATEDHKLVVIGRIVTFVAMIAAIVWSPLLGRFESIFQGVNSMICYIAPPITTVFLWGVLWKGASPRAAQVTLYAGSVLGLSVFLLDWFKETTHWNVPFMMAAFYLFVVCSMMLAALSMIWKRVATPESDRLIWDNPMACLRADETTWRGIGDFRLVSAVLFLTMLGLYWLFA